MAHSTTGHYKYFCKFNKTWCICLLCKQTIKTKDGCTSGLWKHLKNKHPSRHSELTGSEPNSKQPKLDFFGKTNLFPDSYEKDLMTLICKNLYILHDIANNDGLRKWCKAFWRVKIPQTPAGGGYQLSSYASAAESKIKDFIKNHDNVSVSADEWTSSNGKRYLNVNCHVRSFNSEGEAVSNKIFLGFVRIQDAATGDYLASLLIKKLESFGIKDCFFITTDGASVMKVAANNANLNQQQCFLHGINLAIGDIFYKKVTFFTSIYISFISLFIFFYFSLLYFFPLCCFSFKKINWNWFKFFKNTR